MKSSYLKWKFEGLSWIFSILCTALVILPFLLNSIQHPFFLYNCLFILVFIHFTKYIFLLKHTPLAFAFVFKLIIIFTALPLMLVLIDGLSSFQKYVDEIGIQELVKHLNNQKQTVLGNYIQVEMIFFGVGSIVSAIILPIRMIISIWRVRNLKNKV